MATLLHPHCNNTPALDATAAALGAVALDGPSTKKQLSTSEGINYDGNKICKVSFRVAVDLLPGEHVKVLGSDAHLGWDYDRGLTLTAAPLDGANTQVWTGSIDMPTNTVVEYKYVVCSDDGPSFSLSSTRRLLTRKTPLALDDGEFKYYYNEAKSSSLAHQLMVQLEVPPSYTSKPGLSRLGITLQNKGERVESVHVCTRDSASKAVEGTTLREAHEVSTFNFKHSGDVKSLHFEVKTTSTLGRAVVLTSQLFPTHHGVIMAPLLDSSFSVIGELSFRYLIVTPFIHPRLVHTPVPAERMPIPSPRSPPSLLIGHRGTGAAGSRELVDGKIRSHIRENTVLSFATAGSLGAEIVEFDVHLTSDLVPVIYHDFSTHSHDSHTPIHSLSYAQFMEMGKRRVVKTTSMNNLKELSGSSESGGVMSPPIHDNFPTLKEVLQKVPKNIGFNVEIKYPIEDEVQRFDVHPVNRNIYLDCILWEIYEHAKDRFIVFSSFDPEICYMLIKKQPHYPVFFLSQLGTEMRSDPRSNSIDASIHFANSIGLGGIVCPARHLLENAEAAKRITESGLRLWTWGKDNNDPANIRAQQAMGVNGIIADHVGHVAKHWPKPTPHA